MTLILTSTLGGHTVMVADTLLTTRDLSVAGYTPPAMFREEAKFHLEEFDGFKLSRLTQKLIVISPEVAVTWAGQSQKSAKVIRAIAPYLKYPPDLDQIVSDLVHGNQLTHDDLDGIALLIWTCDFRANGKVDFRISGWGPLIHGEVGDERVFMGGTGAQHFRERLSLTDNGGTLGTGPFPEHGQHLRSYFARAVAELIAEVTNGSPYENRYGGALELAYAGPGGRIYKLPYTVIFWSVFGDELRLVGPIFRTVYDEGGRMLVARIAQGLPTRLEHVRSSIDEYEANNAVEDRMTGLSAHVIFRSESTQARVIVDNELKWSGPASFEGFEISEATRERLLGASGCRTVG